MEQVEHLNGHVYHMMHIDNLASVFRQGALLSKEKLSQKGIQPHSIAYESVQDKRDRIFIWDFFIQSYRSLHSYVPFYFAIHPPMLYVQRKEGIHDQIVFFEVKRSVLRDQGVLFTDGNASLQQLSGAGTEKVGIIPAATQESCIRRYFPGGPYGTNEATSNIYNDVFLLNMLDWEGINHTRRIEPWSEYLRIRSAEALIPDTLSLTEIEGIAVNTTEMSHKVNAIAAEYELRRNTPLILVKPFLFLR